MNRPPFTFITPHHHPYPVNKKIIAVSIPSKLTAIYICIPSRHRHLSPPPDKHPCRCRDRACPCPKRQRIIARITDTHEAKPDGHPQGDVPTDVNLINSLHIFHQHLYLLFT
ncbi:MAG: hypothetical protein V1749_09315 [Candidatus Desantisbacteria bacterium]